MSATRTRTPLLLCPATLKKYHAEFSHDPKFYKTIRKMRDRLAISSNNTMSERAILMHKPRHPLRGNKSFKRLQWKLHIAVCSNRREQAVKTLDYLLSLAGITPSGPVLTGCNLLCCLVKSKKRLLCGHTLHFPAFNLDAGDTVWLEGNREPKRGDLIVVGTEGDGAPGPGLELVRFVEWEWDEILAVRPDGEFQYFRPVAISVVSETEKGGDEV